MARAGSFSRTSGSFSAHCKE
ncbi:hypothetical protein [Corynebacterium sp.]